MLTKLHTSIAMAVVSAFTPILMAAAPVLAAPATGPSTSVSQAAGPLSGEIQIPAGGSQWFKFKYHYDNSDSDNEATEAIVTLRTERTNAVEFEIWTLGRMRSPQRDHEDSADDVVTPVGMGTPRTLDTIREREEDGGWHTEELLDPYTLVWSGSQEASDTFYVLVKNTSDAPVNYTISISGPDVSY